MFENWQKLVSTEKLYALFLRISLVHIICNINNDIPIKIPSHPYVLVNRSVLCNCGIEVENHFLLESLAACQDTNSKLVTYFTVNTAFINYLDQYPNLTVLSSQL